MHSVKTKAEVLNIKYREVFSHLQMRYTDGLIILNNKYVQASCKGHSNTHTYNEQCL